MKPMNNVDLLRSGEYVTSKEIVQGMDLYK